MGGVGPPSLVHAGTRVEGEQRLQVEQETEPVVLPWPPVRVGSEPPPPPETWRPRREPRKTGQTTKPKQNRKGVNEKYEVGGQDLGAKVD